MEPMKIQLSVNVEIVIEPDCRAKLIIEKYGWTFDEWMGPLETLDLLNALKIVHENRNIKGEELSEPPFYCLDEGDGKPRCQVQCPFCERV